METRIPRVHVVDDVEEVQTFVGQLLASSGYEVLAYRDGVEFLEGFRSAPPQCLLLDIRLPRLTGLEVQRRLQAQSQDIPVILMTGFGTTSNVVKGFKQGAEDFLEKPLQIEMLLDAVGRAIEKDRTRQQALENRARARDRLAALTPREVEVFELVTRGLPSKNVAESLRLSKKTVDLYRSRLMHKLEAKSVVDLVRLSVSARDELRGL